jgi:hypothetical protein
MRKASVPSSNFPAMPAPSRWNFQLPTPSRSRSSGPIFTARSRKRTAPSAFEIRPIEVPRVISPSTAP